MIVPHRRMNNPPLQVNNLQGMSYEAMSSVSPTSGSVVFHGPFPRSPLRRLSVRLRHRMLALLRGTTFCAHNDRVISVLLLPPSQTRPQHLSLSLDIIDQDLCLSCLNSRSTDVSTSPRHPVGRHRPLMYLGCPPMTHAATAPRKATNEDLTTRRAARVCAAIDAGHFSSTRTSFRRNRRRRPHHRRREEQDHPSLRRRLSE